MILNYEFLRKNAIRYAPGPEWVPIVLPICMVSGLFGPASKKFLAGIEIQLQFRLLVDDFRKDSLEHFTNQAPHSYELILYGFTYFRNYRVFAKRLIEANMSSILQDGINYYFETYLAGDSPSPERPYEMQYYAGALYNLYTRWIQNGVKGSPEFMARIVYNIVNSR